MMDVGAYIKQDLLQDHRNLMMNSGKRFTPGMTYQGLRQTNSVAFVCKRTIPTHDLRGSQCRVLGVEGVVRSAQWVPRGVNLGFLGCSHYFFFQVAPQISSWDWVEPLPYTIFLRKSGSARNRNQDLWICSQELLAETNRTPFDFAEGESLATRPQGWSRSRSHSI
jgi:hypothetical protein